MSNSFRKMNDGSWGVSMTSRGETGQTVSVSLRSGATKQVTLGAFLETISYAGVASYCFAVAPQAPKAEAKVGEMSGILALFAKAKRHLKAPKIVLALSKTVTVRLSIAGLKAKAPGSITLLSGDKLGDGSRAWFGRVTLDGIFQPSNDCPDVAAVGALLSRFACEPAKVAQESAKLVGKCCFCNTAIGEGADQRSVDAGYGPDCADHFGLPWGEKAKTFAGAAFARPSIVALAQAIEARAS